MWGILDKIPYSILIIAAVFMILAPFRPMPHVFEKLMMLKNGILNRPIDIFDLLESVQKQKSKKSTGTLNLPDYPES